MKRSLFHHLPVTMAGMLLAVVLTGCGGPEVDSGPADAAAPAAPVVKTPPEPTGVPADAYASIDACLESYIKAAESGDSEERIRAGKWLNMQGAKAVQPISAALNNPETGRSPQIGLTRLLGTLGSTAAAPLMAAAEKHPERTVRINATGQLSLIKPPTTEIVDKLLALLESDDEEIRRAAVNGLGRIGAKAARAKDPLLKILNSTKESETLRAAAKGALKKVDARHSFVD